MTERCVTYSRVSSDDVKGGKEGRNLDEQVRMCREYAEGKGYSIIAELAEDDRGASGASLDLEQLNTVFTMAKAGSFDVLVVREMDRLSRRLAKQLIIEEELKRAGVEIEYVLATYEDSPEGNLSKQIKAVISEYERLKINERMTRGRRVKAKTGSVICHGHAPFGYNALTEGGKTGLVINPKEAEIVRLIFDWYAQGMALREIQRELNKMGIPTPADGYDPENYHKKRGRGEWARSTIYTILHNETYIGDWYYGKKSPKAPNSTQKINNDRATWIRVEVPAIVPLETWEAVQQILVNNRDAGGGNVKHDYLMRGHVVCGECHTSLYVESTCPRDELYSYYACHVDLVGQQHKKTYFPTPLVDEISWEWVKQLLLDPQAIGEGLNAYKQSQEANAEPTAQHISTIEGILIDKRTSLERLLDLYLSGEYHKDLLIDKKAALERDISELERERASLLASMKAQQITEEQEQTIIDFAQRVADGLHKADESYDTRRAVIDALSIEAILSKEDGQKTVQIRCILGEGYYVLSPAILPGMAE